MSEQKSKSVFQLRNGNWGYRFVVSVGGKCKTQRKTSDECGMPFKTETQARKAREKSIKKAKEELIVAATPAALSNKVLVRRTIEQVYNEYCEKGRSGKAYATKKKQDSLWNNYIKEDFGYRYIDEITVAEVNDYLASLYSDYNLAFKYVESFLKEFYLIFGQAYSRNYMSVDDYNKMCVNKNTKIHMPPMKSTDVTEISSFTKEEINTMDEYFKGKNVETAYMIGKYCGVRVGECYGILWSDIDFENGTITIDKQFKMQDGLAKLIPLKTTTSRRKVYMSNVLKEYLLCRKKAFKTYEVDLAAQRKQNEIMIENVDGSMISSLLLVNTLPNGRYQTDWSIKHHARPLLQKYGIPFKYHTLRHTYGTKLAMMNTPEHILLNQMGHSKGETTRKYYLAVSEDGINELKDNLEKL